MPKPTIQFLSFGSSSETVDWCLDRPYKCPRLLGFILSFPITLVEQASLAELHLVNRNLKTPINSRPTSNKNRSQPKQIPNSQEAIPWRSNISLDHCGPATHDYPEMRRNPSIHVNGMMESHLIEETFKRWLLYNYYMWSNQVVEKHMLAILASSYTQSLEAFLPLTTLKSSRESRKLPCFVFIVISHIVILHKSDVKWWTKLQHAHANYLRLQ